jgi:hypothetical protein
VGELDPLARLVEAVRPWTGQLVLVGGWAHRLYRFHPAAGKVDYRPLLTRDSDLAFSNSANLEGDISAALKQAGFAEQLALGHEPPVTRYTLGAEDGGFYAEFLTPLHGSGVKRSGKPDATLAKAGITAQKLRFLDLLLAAPWSVRLTKEQGFALVEAVDVQVPNPAAFIAQKLLIHDERPREKKPQDLLYIHDTLDLFGANLKILNELWRTTVVSSLSGKNVSRVIEVSEQCFGSMNDVIRDAARIPSDRRLAPEDLRESCRLGLQLVLQKDSTKK